MSRASYLPAAWDNDAEMKGLMSLPKAKHVNPVNYNRVMDFWKCVIHDYCKYEKTCLFSLEELKQKLRRGTQIPSPLNLVLQEMQQSSVLQSQSEYNKKNLGWLEWGFSFLQPTSWFFDNGEKHKTIEKFVHFTALKQMADDLLRYYHDEYQMVDCPEVVEYSELKTSISHIFQPECFDLVVSELVGRGEVSVGKSRFGDKVLKFKDQSTKGPPQFTDVDASVHELRKTMIRLESEIRKSEERMLKFQDQARLVYKKGDKKAALQLMKKKKRVEEEIANKDKQYQNLLVMLQQVAQSKQTREIIDIYKESSAVFKAALNRQGLTVENVDITMENVHEVLNDAHEMDGALREGFRNLPVANDSISDEDLECELNELLADNGAVSLSASNEKLATHETASDLEPNKVRFGKRVLDLSDFPEVPNDGPFLMAKQKKTKHNSNILDERWRRLRAE